MAGEIAVSGKDRDNFGLASGAGVILADEATSDLDAANRERALAALRAEADRGAIVVMATHDPEAAEQTDGELHLDEGVPSWHRPLRSPQPNGQPWEREQAPHEPRQLPTSRGRHRR